MGQEAIFFEISTELVHFQPQTIVSSIFRHGTVAHAPNWRTFVIKQYTVGKEISFSKKPGENLSNFISLSFSQPLAPINHFDDRNGERLWRFPISLFSITYRRIRSWDFCGTSQSSSKKILWSTLRFFRNVVSRNVHGSRQRRCFLR